jgi:hypothetical protein
MMKSTGARTLTAELAIVVRSMSVLSNNCARPKVRAGVITVQQDEIKATKDDRSLQEALIDEISRVEVLAGHYREIGIAGMPALKAFIEPALAQAKDALKVMDVVAMLRAYKALQEIEG